MRHSALPVLCNVLLAPSPSTIRNTRFGGDIPESGISVDRPTGRSFALHELITPQIDQFEESRFWRDLTPQFLMVEGVGPSSDFELTPIVVSFAGE